MTKAFLELNGPRPNIEDYGDDIAGYQLALYWYILQYSTKAEEDIEFEDIPF